MPWTRNILFLSFSFFYKLKEDRSESMVNISIFSYYVWKKIWVFNPCMLRNLITSAGVQRLEFLFLFFS